MENKRRTSSSMEAYQSVHTDICEELRDAQHVRNSFEPMPSSKRLCLRTYTNLESENYVLAGTKYQPCYLNRQLITILSTLGVKDDVFEEKQREFVQKLEASLTDPLEAHETLRLMTPRENTNILEALLSAYEPDCEPFLSIMLQNFRESKLLEIRTNSLIFIHQGRSMMGCLDKTRTLEYGQVVVQFSDPTRPESQYFITGPVVVAKNPCLHPGDVRVLEAVKVPALSHMVDCVVFPQKGARPHPNECSGSDLDGDIYFVCWDPELIPPRTSDPMDYTPEPPLILDHDLEVEEYLSNYDSLGMIADAHTAFADKEPLKAFSDKCIELARIFSIAAVEFPKTGIAPEIPQYLYVKEYPDFMEKLDKPRYESKNVIGKLFREVKEVPPPFIPIESFTQEIAFICYDKDMEVEGFKDYIREAFLCKYDYDYKLGNLMEYYGIKTEAEILSGEIMRMSKSFSKRRDAECIERAVMSLREEALSRFNERKGDDEMAKASAWYHVTYHFTYWGLYNYKCRHHHFLSFAWCVYDKLVKIKKTNMETRQRLGTLDS